MSLDDYIIKTPSEIKTAIVRLENSNNGKCINLIGCIHIALASYYEQINSHLIIADAVLYEGIRRTENQTLQNKQVSLHDKLFFLSAFSINAFYQRIAKAMNKVYQKRLGSSSDNFVCQADGIDYAIDARSWFNADISVSEARRSTNIFSMRNLYGWALFGIFGFLYSIPVLKEIIEEVIAEKILSGNKFGQTSIFERPFEGIHRVREQRIYQELARLEKDRDADLIAILYGAAHLPVIETELSKRGYHRTCINYFTALPRINF